MQVRSVWPALLLATGLASPVAWGSACLRETAPEVEPFLQSGAEPEVRAAIAAIDDRLVDLEPGDAAPWLTAQASMLLDLEAWEEAESLLADAISGWLHNDRIDAENLFAPSADLLAVITLRKTRLHWPKHCWPKSVLKARD